VVPRALGSTVLCAAPVGLGTVKLGRRSGVKYPVDFDLPTDAEVATLLDRARDLGVNLFDTAPAYGSSERRLAPFVKAHRGEIVLATKCGETFEGGSSRWDFRRSALERQIAQSLNRLGTDHVDLLFLHSDGSDEEVLTKTDAVATLLEAKRRGQAHAIGLSAKTGAGIRGAIGVLDAVMAPFSPSEHSLGPALESAHDAGLAVLAIKALQQGRAVDPGAAIGWVTTRAFIDVVVVGTLSPRHLATAVKAVSA
jgi:aryl-alcohol dehydrogenase-like predicted oxidoreductase